MRETASLMLHEVRWERIKTKEWKVFSSQELRWSLSHLPPCLRAASPKPALLSPPGQPGFQQLCPHSLIKTHRSQQGLKCFNFHHFSTLSLHVFHIFQGSCLITARKLASVTKIGKWASAIERAHQDLHCMYFQVSVTQ